TTEVGRADAEVKQAFSEGLARIHQILNTQLSNPQMAWATIAMTVGAVNLARALPAGERQQALLTACQNMILAMAKN
ncbi:MAG TPA: hypothetical protein PLW01_03400, partial [Agitococcus sp.]|nr:hypothetical protein [Agitococcus sp.]